MSQKTKTGREKKAIERALLTMKAPPGYVMFLEKADGIITGIDSNGNSCTFCDWKPSPLLPREIATNISNN